MRKSLDELEGKEWRKPEPGASSTLRRCYDARSKPLSELRTEELRILIGQDIGLVFVVPLALSLLEEEPLLEAEHFGGDLLATVLSASPAFFAAEPVLKARVENLIYRLPMLMDRLEDSTDFDIASEALGEAVEEFRRATSGRPEGGR